MTTISKTCSCGYVGDDFGMDMSQLDGLARYCRPCTRQKAKDSAASRARLVKVWHESPEFVAGTMPGDAWRVANGFKRQQGRPPSPRTDPAVLANWLTGAAPLPDETSQADYERMAYGGPPVEPPRNPNLPD